MTLRGVGLSPAGTASLLWLSLGVDLGPDSGNALGCWSESLVEQLPSWPCQRPGMTCWLQTMTCEHVPPKGDQSMSQWAPGPPSSMPFQAAAWGRSTPQVPLSLAPSHWHLWWWDADEDRHNWSHGWTWALLPCRPLPSVTSASPWAFLGMWWSTSRHLCGHPPKGHWRCSWWHQACACMTKLPLDFVVQSRGSHHHQGLQWIQIALMPCRCSGNLPEEGATLGLLLPKQGKLWCFWHETPAYIGFMTLIHSPTPGQFFTPANHHPAFIVSDWFLGMVGGANIADQRKSTCRHQLLVLCTCRLQEKHSWIFWNNIRTHSPSYIKT